jgi:hypothetical protein
MSFGGFAQRAGSFDTIKIRGGGSFGNTVVLDTSQIKQLDTAVDSHDAVPLFQIMDSISEKSGLWQDDGTIVTLITPRDVDLGDNTIDTKRLLQSNNGGSIFIGEYAGLNDDLRDNHNVFIGRGSGQGNISGFNNAANGYTSLRSNTTGTHNTANGSMSLVSNTTGTYNTAVGSWSGAHYGSSSSLNETGSYNTFLGYDTRASADSTTNQIVIGANAVGNGSNTATILDDNGTDVYMGENGQANIHINALHDTENDIGTNGQILSSTSTGTNWIDNLLYLKVFLSTAEVAALGTKFELIPAPGVGSFLQVVAVSYFIDVGVQLDVGAQGLAIGYYSGSNPVCSINEAQLESANDLYLQLLAEKVNAEFEPNDSFGCVLTAATNPSGSATMTFYITYKIITL